MEQFVSNSQQLNRVLRVFSTILTALTPPLSPSTTYSQHEVSDLLLSCYCWLAVTIIWSEPQLQTSSCLKTSLCQQKNKPNVIHQPLNMIASSQTPPWKCCSVHPNKQWLAHHSPQQLEYKINYIISSSTLTFLSYLCYMKH